MVDQLYPKHFDSFPVVFSGKPKNIIAIDPGHQNILAVVRVRAPLVRNNESKGNPSDMTQCKIDFTQTTMLCFDIVCAYCI
jgi:hypothetical protein